VVPYLTSFMDAKAADAITSTFLDTSYEVTQERVKEVRRFILAYVRPHATSYQINGSASWP
jgi:hypothetical protein